MTSPSQESSIAPNGDVIFLVGPEKREFRVYSTVLKISSTVFNAMLEPHFKEGQNLIKECLIEIPLPDDDPDALSNIFNIIHSRHDLVPTALSAIQVLQVAITSDKYNMNNALKFAIKQWLNVDNVDAVSLWHLTMAAYLFNESEPFKGITLKLILNYSGSYIDLMLKHDCVNLEVFAKVSCMLEECRNRLRTEIYGKILHELLRINTLCSCGWYSRYATLGVEFINTYKYQPKAIGSKDVSKMISELKMLPEPKIESRYHNNCNQYHELPYSSLQDYINQSINSLLADLRGLCLTCLQTNNEACTH